MSNRDFKVKSDTDVLFNSMIEVISLLDSFNITSFLNYGALLGYVREKRLLPWNNDVELCAYLNEEFKENIVSVMVKLDTKGYNVTFHEYSGTLSIQKKNVDINVNLVWQRKKIFVRPHETGAKKTTSNFIAFYLYWAASYMFVFQLGKSKNQRSIKDYSKITFIKIVRVFPFAFRHRIYATLTGISKIFGARYLLTSYPCYFFDHLKTVNFNGFKVKIPQRSEDLLIYLYGDNWETPKENWCFYHKKNKDQTNIRYIEGGISILDWKIIDRS